MERVFDMSRWWIWVINGLVTVGCFVAYILIDGTEVLYAQYIPLDLFLNVCKTIFYFYYYYRDHRDKEDEKRINERVMKKQSKLGENVDNTDLKMSLLDKAAEDSDSTSNGSA